MTERYDKRSLREVLLKGRWDD